MSIPNEVLVALDKLEAADKGAPSSLLRCPDHDDAVYAET